MLVEVTERAMAHAEKKEAMLGGWRGRQQAAGGDAGHHVPGEGGEILFAGAEVHGGQRLHDRLYRPLMMKSGVVTGLAESKVRPGYRTDDVPVTWA